MEDTRYDVAMNYFHHNGACESLQGQLESNQTRWKKTQKNMGRSRRTKSPHKC